MKKTLLILMISTSLLLAACMNNSTPNHLELPEVDIETCGDSCENGDNYWQMLMETKENRNFDIYFQDQDHYQTVSLGTGETVDREALLRADKINGSLSIAPEYGYRPFERYVATMNYVILSCEGQNPCTNIPQIMTDDMTLSNAAIGYDERSGYYDLTILYGEETRRREKFQYEVKEDYINYEVIQYYPMDEQYEYSIMVSGVLRTYEYNNQSNLRAYTYINTLTYESLFYAYNDDRMIIEYLNPQEQISYSFSSFSNRPYEYSITSYLDFENVVNLASEGESYFITFNFHFMNGWDQITCNLENAFSCELFNEGTPVFDSYEILQTRKTVFYNNITATINLSSSEFDDYTFPEEFQVNHSLTTLKDKLATFMNLDNPAMILPFSDEELQSNFDEVLEYLNKQ